MTFQPAAPEPGDLSNFFLNIRKIHPKTKLFPQITYPITPKTKPIIPVYAKVSDVPPPLRNNNFKRKTATYPQFPQKSRRPQILKTKHLLHIGHFFFFDFSV